MCACLRQEDSTDNDGDDIDDICRHLTATSMGAIGAPINPIVERYGMSKLSCGWPDWVSGNASTETKFVRICEAARENAEYANRTISRSAALNENINEVGRSRGRARSLFVATSRDVYRPLPHPPCLPPRSSLVRLRRTRPVTKRRRGGSRLCSMSSRSLSCFSTRRRAHVQRCPSRAPCSRHASAVCAASRARGAVQGCCSLSAQETRSSLGRARGRATSGCRFGFPCLPTFYV